MLKDQIKTPSDFKMFYQECNPNGHFFDAKTMKFFGDTMANFGLRKTGAYWEIYRKRPVKHGLQSSHYFTDEFKQAYPTAEELTTLTSKQAVVPTVPASPQKSLVAEAIDTGRMVIADARAPLPLPRKPSSGGMKM